MRVAALVLLALGFALSGGTNLVRDDSNGRPAEPRGHFTRGVALGLFATDPDWNYGPLVEEIHARGATDVLVVVNAYQTDRFASDITARPGHTPSLATVRRTLSQVRGIGMRPALMPVVRLTRRAAHEWRGLIAPADGLHAWFDAYRSFVLPLATLAESEDVVTFVVGSELSSLEAHSEQWRALIGEIRARFSGELTYSTNWDHIDAVTFWDALDAVGLTAYFPLGAAGERLSDADLARAWQGPVAEIESLAHRVGKPVVVTEIGYPSQRDAASAPWDHVGSNVVDLELQRRLYRGFCDAFAEADGVSGFYVWNWFGVGGPHDRGFTPRGKPAATELASCFERSWPSLTKAGHRR